MDRNRAILRRCLAWRPSVASFFAPGLRYYGLMIAFFTVVFAIIPFTIYAHSGEDWGFPSARLLPLAGFGLVLFAGMGLVIQLLAVWDVGAARTTATALFCLGTFLLLAHVYAPIQIGPLDGSEMVSEKSVRHSLIELAILPVMIWIFMQLRRGRGLPMAALFSLALVLASFGYASVAALSDRGRQEWIAEPAPVGTAGASEIAGNVYHIVLDRMQTDAVLAILKRSPQSADFEGFDLFKNNIANYISTIPSTASYLTGTLYKSGAFQEWIKGWQSRGLFATMADLGYQTWMYAPFRHWNSPSIDHFRYNIDLYEAETGIADAGFLELVSVWLASLAPNLLTNEALPIAAALRGPLFGLLTGNPEPLTIADGVDPYAGMLMLRNLRRDEQHLPPTGRYVYAHAALPHGPFVLDRHCRYVGKEQRGVKAAYLDQAECAVALIGGFLNELRRLGRYDPATILLHADTGHGIGGIAGKTRPAGSRTLGVSDIGLVYTVQALLMIKRPGASGTLRILDTPTQLVDLFPTMLDLLDLEPDYQMDGKSVYALAPDERREARFGFDPDKRMDGPNIIEVHIEDPVDLAHSRLTVLGPATDPASWRARPPK